MAGRTALFSVGACLLAFQGEEVKDVEVNGTLHESGVDDNASIMMKFKDGGIAIASCCTRAQLQNELHINGDLGMIKMKDFWCGNHVEFQKLIPGSKYLHAPEVFNFKMPETDEFYNFVNSPNLAFEADAARDAIINGKTGTDKWTHNHSIQVSRILTKARLAIGYRLPEDDS